jgi:hypothetical protein
MMVQQVRTRTVPSTMLPQDSVNAITLLNANIETLYYVVNLCADTSRTSSTEHVSTAVRPVTTVPSRSAFALHHDVCPVAELQCMSSTEASPCRTLKGCTQTVLSLKQSEAEGVQQNGHLLERLNCSTRNTLKQGKSGRSVHLEVLCEAETALKVQRVRVWGHMG